MIRCSYCKTENADSAKECRQCGKPILHKMLCANPLCRLDLSEMGEKIQFCPQCGETLKRVVPSPEPVIITMNVVDYPLEMVLVEAGTFLMGASSEQQYPEKDEYPIHKVVLPFDYYIAKNPVTIRLWNTVMGGKMPKDGNPTLPVTNVSRKDCIEFCKELSRITGQKFRLPTEAEWEYAARGGRYGKHTIYSGSDSLDDIGWFNKNSGDQLHQVNDIKHPNELGILGMSGNIEEWCLDAYMDYLEGLFVEPCSYIGNSWVTRGGSYNSSWQECRVSKRKNRDRGDATIGFRAVMQSTKRNEKKFNSNICDNEECKTDLSSFPYDISFCPYCGKNFRNTRIISLEKSAWQYAQKNDDYKKFIKDYPNSIYIDEAAQLLTIIEDKNNRVGEEEENFWEKKKMSLLGSKEYIQHYPKGKHISEARARRDYYDKINNRKWINKKDFLKDTEYKEISPLAIMIIPITLLSLLFLFLHVIYIPFSLITIWLIIHYKKEFYLFYYFFWNRISHFETCLGELAYFPICRSNSNKYGIIYWKDLKKDAQYDVILPCDYDILLYMEDNIYLYSYDGKYGLLKLDTYNRKYKIILPLEWDFIMTRPDHDYYALKNNKEYIIKKEKIEEIWNKLNN